MVDFYRERMNYTLEAEEEGALGPEAVWEATEKAQLTIHDHEQEVDGVSVLRHTIARQYGGEQWQELLGMLPR